MKTHITDCIEILLENSTIENISVKDITDLADISKATFYRYFIDKYDALCWIYYKVLEKNREKCPDIFDQTFHNLTFLQSRKDIQKAMLSNAQNNLYSFTEDFSFNQHIELAKTFYHSEDIPPVIESAIYTYITGAGMTTLRWLQNGAKESPSFLVESEKATLSPLLLEIFSIDASAAAVEARSLSDK